MDADRWVAEQRADEAGRERARERWLRLRAEEGATFVGVLCDLAEAGRPVVVQTSGGRSHAGTLRGVGPDHAVMRSSVGADVLVRTAAITAVRALGGAVVDGDRPAPLDTTFIEAVGRLLADRPRVQVITVAGVMESGELASVGTDVLSLTLGDRSGPAGSVVIPLAGIADLTILG